jgi:biopolymer transport protein ExbD
VIPYRARAVTRLPLTALVDVVFILLFFFMLASSLDDWRRLAMPLSAVGAEASATVVQLRLQPAGTQLEGRSLDDAETLARLEATQPSELNVQVASGVDMQRLVDWLRRLESLGIAASVSVAPRGAEP